MLWSTIMPHHPKCLRCASWLWACCASETEVPLVADDDSFMMFHGFSPGLWPNLWSQVAVALMATVQTPRIGCNHAIHSIEDFWLYGHMQPGYPGAWDNSWRCLCLETGTGLYDGTWSSMSWVPQTLDLWVQPATALCCTWCRARPSPRLQLWWRILWLQARWFNICKWVCLIFAAWCSECCTQNSARQWKQINQRWEKVT